MSKLLILLLIPSLAWPRTPSVKPDLSAAPVAEKKKDDYGVVLKILNDGSRGPGGAATPSSGRVAIGLGTGLPEGKPLEMALWSGYGAIAGAVAGPFGAMVGGAAGALVGLAVAVFAVPHNGPGKASIQ